MGTVIETLSQLYNIREPGVFWPAISATVAVILAARALIRWAIAFRRRPTVTQKLAAAETTGAAQTVFMVLLASIVFAASVVAILTIAGAMQAMTPTQATVLLMGCIAVLFLLVLGRRH